MLRKIRQLIKELERAGFINRGSAFDKFNEWEKQRLEKPDVAACLAAVFELYDLVPFQARQRPVNVEGIIRIQLSARLIG
jgi:hypothetical protein